MKHDDNKLKKNYLTQFNAATVIGLGATGYSVVRYLRARGLNVHVIDSREAPAFESELASNYPDVGKQFGDFKKAKISANSLLVVSPGVPLSEPLLREAKNQGCILIGDIELFLEENTQPVIAITGSNGKSTVTELTGELCKAGGLKPLIAGNIGLPVLDALTDGLDYNVAVLELSSFQLETTSRMPVEVATILNISADHMDRYDSEGDYVLAKARILKGAERAVLPRHDEQLAQISKFGTARKIQTFGLDEPSNDDEFGVKRSTNFRWLMKGDSKLIRLRDISLTGMHNVSNILAAFALVDFLKLDIKALVQAIKAFTGLPHRMQTVAQVNSIRWVNDSKATNIGATRSALTSLEQPVIWIAGGQGKGANFNELRDAITSNITLLLLFGEDADQIENALTGLLPIQRVSNMAQAVALAAANATQDSIVLLSPACASFDMYRGFEHRGDDFRQCVNDYTQQVAS